MMNLKSLFTITFGFWLPAAGLAAVKPIGQAQFSPAILNLIPKKTPSGLAPQKEAYLPERHGDVSDLTQNVYVYESQHTSKVNWLYTGFAPRVEQGGRIEVVFSKPGRTMRVTLKMTRGEVASYPRYLVRRANEIKQIINETGVTVFQQKKLKKYYETVGGLKSSHSGNLRPGYSKAKFRKGLQLLKTFFPGNIFISPASEDENAIAVIAHFVYPITVHNRASWPAARTYWLAVEHRDLEAAIWERRSRYSGSSHPIRRHVFGGFPAFFFKSTGKGTGVHGPIRYSRPNEAGGMLGHWDENEFLGNNGPSREELPSVLLRWDIVRKANSDGCFRAETMELRALLPADPVEIFHNIGWKVIDSIDQIQTAEGAQFVDVNYYKMDPYRNALSREDWIRQELKRDPEEFKASSYLFNYLDPATLEFKWGGGSAAPKTMGRFNQAGGYIPEPPAADESEEI